MKAQENEQHEACGCVRVVVGCAPYRCPICGEKLSRAVSKVPVVEEKSVKEEKQEGRKDSRKLDAPCISLATPITKIKADKRPRQLLGLPIVDDVLGGIVLGGVYLLGGEPGIGKSTLLMQMAKGFLNAGQKVLYISAEESAQRARERGERAGVLDDNLLICVETELHQVLNALHETQADVLLLDSIQRVHDVKLASQAGSPSQVRQVCEVLLDERPEGVTLFIVGHVTKGGALAGPKVLEHLVDVVLSLAFEDEERVLASKKSRF